MALETLKKAWRKRPGLRLSSKFSKWRKKQGDKKNRNKLKRYESRAANLAKIEKPNDYQKNLINHSKDMLKKLRNKPVNIRDAQSKGKVEREENEWGPKGQPMPKPESSKNNNKTKPPKPSTKAVWNSEKFRWEVPANVEANKSKTSTSNKNQNNKEKVKIEKKVEKKPEKKDDGGRAEWLKKTRNSPAAKAGFSEDERWALQQKHRKWKASRGKK